MAQMRIFVSHSHEDDAFCRALGRDAEAEQAERRAKALGG